MKTRTISRPISVRESCDNILFMGTAKVRLDDGRPEVVLQGVWRGSIVRLFDPVPSNSLDDIFGVDLDLRFGKYLITLIGSGSYRSVRTASLVEAWMVIDLLP